MNQQQFEALLHEEGEVCISIILPTSRFLPERRTKQLQLERAVDRVKHKLHQHYTREQYVHFTKKLTEITSSIDFNLNKDGIGIFVSSRIEQVIYFDFPVREKEQVAEFFSLRELIHYFNLQVEYYLLELDEKHARLFRGMRDYLEEINDSDFPRINDDLFEYSSPTKRSLIRDLSNVMTLEEDQSVLEEVKKDFLIDVDDLMELYLQEDTPLVVMGTEREVSYYKEISNYTENIALAIPDNNTEHSVVELSKLVWPQLKLHLQNKKDALINDFEEKRRMGLAISGIQDIWIAAKEGRGAKLLVEKDFSFSGFVNKDRLLLYLSETENANQYIPDAIDEIIKNILINKGMVKIMENDALKPFGRMALILRF